MQNHFFPEPGKRREQFDKAPRIPFGTLPDSEREMDRLTEKVIAGSPRFLLQIRTKTVKKSKNGNDAGKIVCYNKDGQKGAG